MNDDGKALRPADCDIGRMARRGIRLQRAEAVAHDLHHLVPAALQNRAHGRELIGDATAISVPWHERNLGSEKGLFAETPEKIVFV